MGSRKPSPDEMLGAGGGGGGKHPFQGESSGIICLFMP